MDPKAKEKLGDAIYRFFDNYRFYYCLLTRMARAERSDVPTIGVGFGSSGSIPTLVYNPEFVNKLDDKELIAILNHECQHIGLKHLERRGNHDKIIANVAMDVIVNSNIPEIKQLPRLKEMCVMAEKFEELKGMNVRDLTWEDIYGLIKPAIDKEREKMQQQFQQALASHDGWDGQGEPQECDACGGTGKDAEGKPCSKCNGTGKDGEGQQMTVEQQAAMKGLMQDVVRELGGRDPGNVPGAIRRIIEQYRTAKMNWKQQLSIFAQSSAKEDVRPTWKKVSRRFGYIAPGKKKDYRPKLLCVIDNSGSVDKKTYSDFVAHILKIAEFCETVDGIGVDTRVNFECKFEKGKAPKYEDTRSGGGTDFQPAFDYAKGKGYDGIIYLTDGYANNDIDTHRIPVIFAICPHGVEVKGRRNVKLEDEA